MYTVELRVDIDIGIGGSDNLPHGFLIVTGPDGVKRGYGLGPVQHGTLTGDGMIYDDTNHDYNASTGPIELTQEGWDKLQNYIQESQASPPPYYLPFGSQCANWAMKGMVESGAMDSTYSNLEPDNFFKDVSETVVNNPYAQWVEIKAQEAWESGADFVSDTYDSIIEAVSHEIEQASQVSGWAGCQRLCRPGC